MKSRLVRAAGAVLGTGLLDAAELGGSRRSAVLRCRRSDTGDSVIVKAYRPTQWGRDSFVREAAGLAFAEPAGVSPRLLAADPAVPLVVMTDLGTGPSVADLLLTAGAAASDTLLRWAAACGRLAAWSAGPGLSVELGRLRSVYDGSAEPADPARIGAAILSVPNLIEQAGVAVPAALDSEIAGVAELLGDGRYQVFSPGDLCPDNNLVTDGGVRLIDYEDAGFHSVFLDAAYWRMPFSTCWCVGPLPAGLAAALERTYREAVGAAFPDLAADEVWQPGVRRAGAVWTLHAMSYLLDRALGEDRSMNSRVAGAPTARQLLRYRWGTLGSWLSAAGELPVLAGVLRDLLAATECWQVADLPAYPALPASVLPGVVGGEMSDPAVNVKHMFTQQQPDAIPGEQQLPDQPPPLERLEAQICELAGHLAAATCRFLTLLGDFDARRGWASWDMNSCAQWLAWKCQMTSGTAREHVRVARALRDLPVIRAEFAAGRMSFSKARAITRIATPETDAGLAEITAAMTGSQAERFARAHRQVSHADDITARVRRRLAWRLEDDGTMTGTFRLPPLQGAVLLQALRAAAGDVSHSHDHEPHAGGPHDGEPEAKPTTGSLADALTVIAEAYLAEKIAAADNPDVYQVIVHASAGLLTGHANARDVSAETPEPPAGPVGPADPVGPAEPTDPAGPGRCHVEDGPAISVTTLDMLTCEATMSWILHDHDGTLLDAGHRRRRPTPAIRRAARERDHYRCRFPGCESRRTDLHHIRYWRNGGPTTLSNMISLCRTHHRLVHDRDYLIAAGPAGTFSFFTADGGHLPAAPALPVNDARIEACHDADVTFQTIIPAWYGERLDLDYAIATCFANAQNTTQDEAGRRREPEPAWRPEIDYLAWAE